MQKTVPVAAIAVVALLLSGCTTASGGGDDSETAVLRLGWGVAPASLDPAEIQEGQSILFEQALYDSLLTTSPDGQLQPGLASEWSYNEDLTELTLTLRDGVTFTDGSPVDAAAVVAGIEHIQQGTSTGSQYASSITAADAVDDGAVVLTLSEPDPSLLYSLSTYAGFIASPQAIESGTLAESPVGSGPYVLDESRTDTGVTYAFTRNEDYWDAAEYPYEEVVITIFDDDTAKFNALSSGQVDGMFGTTQKIAAAKAAGLNVAIGSPVEWRGLLLNDRLGQAVPALSDMRVRQAINYAFDRQGILDALFEGEGVPTTQVFNPAGAAWNEDVNDAYPYDPDKARELLAEAGFPDGFDLPVATYPGLMDEVNPIVEQQLGDVGIRVQWVVASPSSATVWQDMLGTPALVMSMGTYLSPWTDILNVAAPTAMMNPQQIETPEFDAIIERIKTSTGDEQAGAYQNASKYLVDNAWFAPWLALNGAYFTSPELEVQMQAGQIIPSLRNFRPAE